MTAVAAPAKYATTVGDLGFSYVFAAREIRTAIAEKLSAMPFLELYGDLAGSGSNTMRVTFIDGVGWAEAFTAMAAEDTSITPTGWTSGYDTVTVGRYGLGKAATYTNELLGRAGGPNLDYLKARIPESIEKTYRGLLMSSGAGISTAVGAVTTAWDVDDHIALGVAFNETDGYDGGRVSAIFHSEQMSDFRDSLRSEPSQMFAMQFEEQQALKGFGYQFTMNNIDFYSSNDVTQSGGGHQSFAFAPGAFGRAIASTGSLQVENPDRAIIIPQIGLVVEEKTSGGQNATRQWFANLYAGVGRADATVVPQFRCLSIDN